MSLRLQKTVNFVIEDWENVFTWNFVNQNARGFSIIMHLYIFVINQ